MRKHEHNTTPAAIRLQEALERDPIAAAQLEALNRLTAALERHAREVDELRAVIHYGIGCGR